MNDNDFARFCETWAGVQTIYGKEVTAPVLRAVFGVLQKYPLDAVEAALQAHMDDPDAGRFPPTPAHVVGKIRPSDADAAAIAWSRVVKAIRHVGYMATPDCGDRRIHAAINSMGGWSRLCVLQETALPFAARDFATLYLNADALPAPLPIGAENASRIAHGQLQEPHVLIGADGKPEGVPGVPVERHLPEPPPGTPLIRDRREALRSVMRVLQGGKGEDDGQG
ncbi:MAG TPA: hypothetical protein DCY89_05655 [Gammaproteobacteria bacterium]|nr:hypothetical protein [Gammaproteobacteria bacterium]